MLMPLQLLLKYEVKNIKNKNKNEYNCHNIKN